MQLTSGRLAAVVIGIPVMLASAVFGAFSLVGTFARTSEQHTATYASQGGLITVRTSGGSIQVRVGTGNQVGVVYTEHYELRKPTVTATTLIGGVQLLAQCPAGVFDNNCEINYVVTVPASTSILLQTGDGDISGELQTKTVSASTGDGDVQLQWEAAPTHVVATTGDGDISLVVPQGSGPYNVSAHTGDGGTHMSVPQDPAATASITASTGDGGIDISPVG